MRADSVWTRLREAANWVNTSTLLGLLIARLGGASIDKFHRGTWLATNYRYSLPAASAFTVGNVIVTRSSRQVVEQRTALLHHEDRHCTQFAFCLGPVMLPIYVVAMAVSWLLTGSHAALNPFERLANLADGGYSAAELRSGFRRGR